jgi:hypothetical protein
VFAQQVDDLLQAVLQTFLGLVYLGHEYAVLSG